MGYQQRPGAILYRSEPRCTAPALQDRARTRASPIAQRVSRPLVISSSYSSCARLHVRVAGPVHLYSSQSHRGGEVAYRDLRDFLNTLEKKDELRRITVEVDPILEITEITDRVVKAGGPALLFENPKGSRIPVVTNLVGTERRMNLALEVDSLDEVADRVHSYIDMQSPQGFLEKVKMLPKLAELGSFFPKTVRSGECQEVVRTENLSL